MTNLVKFNSISELKELCSIIAKSGLHKGETPEQAFTKIMYGQELGLPPMAARSSIHVIQGKPTLSSNAMATALDNHPSYDYVVTESTNEVCTIEFYKKRDIQWLKRGTSTFTFDDAKRAQLIKAGGGWIKYPKAMLFARCISQGIRMYAPGCFSQPVYTPEELGIVDAVDVTPTTVEPVITPNQPILPFKTTNEALVWAGKKLNIDDSDVIKAIMNDTEPDEKGRKAHNFYVKVMDMFDDDDIFIETFDGNTPVD